MTFLEKLNNAVEANDSLLCVGLDPALERLPEAIRSQPRSLFEFNKTIIDATASSVCAYKPNSAFYEALGAEGIEQLKQTISYICREHPDIPVILDAKRADIGSTNEGYVSFAFDYLGADAITLHPYLGREALQPFLEVKDKGMIILCRTSNSGVADTQDVLVGDQPYYLHLAKKIIEWNTNGNCLLVTGATYPKEISEIRQTVGDGIWFLVPGIGAQGGDLEQTLTAGLTKNGKGLIINSARGIIFSDNPAKEAEKLRAEINKYRKAT